MDAVVESGLLAAASSFPIASHALAMFPHVHRIPVRRPGTALVTARRLCTQRLCEMLDVRGKKKLMLQYLRCSIYTVILWYILLAPRV